MITIIVPLSGHGRTFAEHGYTFPKPLIEVGGRPMIEVVVSALRVSAEHRFVFVCRREHLRKYALSEVLELVAPGCSIVSVDGETAGALCSVLLAVDLIDSDELVIANGDQVVDEPLDNLLASARRDDADGAMFVFPSTHPKWSYAKTDENGVVVAVAEKRPISRNATAGIYYFKRGSDFVAAATNALAKGDSLNGEFYICPVYNEYVLDGRKVTVFPIDRSQMHSLGTPEDLTTFERTHS